MDKGAWQGTVQGTCHEESDTTEATKCPWLSKVNNVEKTACQKMRVNKHLEHEC